MIVNSISSGLIEEDTRHHSIEDKARKAGSVILAFPLPKDVNRGSFKQPVFAEVVRFDEISNVCPDKLLNTSTSRRTDFYHWNVIIANLLAQCGVRCIAEATRRLSGLAQNHTSHSPHSLGIRSQLSS